MTINRAADVAQLLRWRIILSMQLADLRPRPEVYETYWYFAAERQNIFFNKIHHQPLLTQDPILQHYKFCNVYRASDRVSQFLINQVIYDGQPRSAADTIFRIILFRLLNKNDTWSKLEARLNGISLANFNPIHYAQIIENLRSEGHIIYGNAFILCANKAFGFDQKHRNHLGLLDYIFNQSQIGEQLMAANSLKQLFDTLLRLPLIGNFMAYQLAIDLNYSPIFNFDENDFTSAGPGALRGISKCFLNPNHISPENIIQWMVEHQTEELNRLRLPFQPLGDRLLHAIDCQGLFCEVDKYSRVKFPQLASNRIKIKAMYQPHSESITYTYPPKWHISIG